MALHPFRHINPGVRGGKVKFGSKEVALIAVFAGLYAAGVVLLMPISFGVYQVRVADALLPLSIIFGLPSAIGLSLGCLVANVYGGLGIIDVVGGTVANFGVHISLVYWQRGVHAKIFGKHC